MKEKGGAAVEERASYYEGCLLGMAVGDALGCTVDDKTLDQILADYGPNGIMGYDSPGDYAEISTHTQLAALAGNGLLVALSKGKTGEYSRFIALALREWLHSRYSHGAEADIICWLNRMPELLRRNCTDSRVTDSLHRERLGTVDAPVNRADTPSALMVPVAVGLFYEQRRMDAGQVGTLGADAAALLCGAPEAFMAGAAVAYMIAGILQEPQLPLREHFLQTAAIIRSQFSKRFPQALEVSSAITFASKLAQQPQPVPRDVMEELACESASRCLAGAVYACLVHPASFDEALVTAVNHSGRSAATAAITGAIMGAKLGKDAIPDFYLETLESGSCLSELARDLALGNPASGLFDDDWEQKYTFGRPV